MPGPHVVRIPMRERFRGITARESMLIAGPAGWGEFAAFWDYGVEECAPWLRAAREAADVGWPAAVRTSVPVNATVPAVDPQTAAAIVAGSRGCRSVKVKVAERGQPDAADIERVQAVREAIGRDGHIRVDANGAWDVDTAVRRIKALDEAAAGLEYVEQPCPTIDDLAAVRRAVDVPIAADESVRRVDDPLRVARAGAADIVVLKVAPLGGVRACLDIAERCGLPVVVSSAVETSVGIAAGVALAAALPDLPYACGLATVQLLTGDVVDAPLLPVAGELPVRRPEPSAELLDRWAADAPTHEHWVNRWRAVEALA